MQYYEPRLKFGDVYAGRAAELGLPNGSTEKAMAFYREPMAVPESPAAAVVRASEQSNVELAWAVTKYATVEYKLIGRVAVPLAAVGVTHAVTGDVIWDIAAGCAALGSYEGGRRVPRLVSRMIDRFAPQQAALAPVDHDQPEMFKLPYSGIGDIVGGRLRDYFLERPFDVQYDGLSVTGRTVLEWLERRYANNRSPVRFNGDGSAWYSTGTGTSVRTDTTLFGIYLEAQGEQVCQDNAKESRLYHAARFLDAADKIAANYGLELQPADSPRFGGQHGPEFVNWRDVSCSMINMFPGEHLQSMLKEAVDPAGLWNELTWSLRYYAESQAAILDKGKRAHHLRQIGKLTDVPSAEHSTELAGIETNINSLYHVQLVALLGMSAIGMVHLRRQKVQQFTDEMLKTMEEAHGTAVMHDILDLYDIASTAFAVHDAGDGLINGLEPADLRPYLTQAANLADGTDESFRRLYGGMSNKFPQLNLPEQPPRRREPIGYVDPQST